MFTLQGMDGTTFGSKMPDSMPVEETGGKGTVVKPDTIDEEEEDVPGKFFIPTGIFKCFCVLFCITNVQFCAVMTRLGSVLSKMSARIHNYDFSPRGNGETCE